MKSVTKSVSNAERVVHKTLTNKNNRMLIRMLLVGKILIVKYLPTKILATMHILAVRILMALTVAYLCYVDLISATLFALSYVISIQELRSRRSSVIPVNSDTTENTTDSFANVVDVTEEESSDEVTYELEEQTEMARTNMNQGKQSDDIGGLGSNPLPEFEYDVHPALMTLTENIKSDGNTGSFTTPQHLLDAQINSAQGADTNVYCAVKPIKDIWNTQGLGSQPIMGNDLDINNNSRVN